MKHTIKTIGIIALITIIGFSFISCDNGGGGGAGGGGGGGNGGGVGVTATVSIEKTDARTFTVTQEGSKWNSYISNGFSNISAFFAEQQITVTHPTAGTSSIPISSAFNVTRNSDTLITFSLRDDLSAVSGTITINTVINPVVGNVGLLILFDVDENKTNTIIINPAKASITF